jgi:hypothetical protein
LAANLVSGQIRFFKITEFVEKVNMGFKFVWCRGGAISAWKIWLKIQQ